MTSRDYLKVALGLGLTAGVLTAVTSGPAIAQGPLKPLQALILNTPSEPVPVLLTGTTSVDGVVAVRNLDEPGRSPYQEVKIFVPCQVSSNPFSEVPAGKRLVIKHVSAHFALPIDGGITAVSLNVNELKIPQFLNAHLLPFNTLQNHYSVNDDVLVYSEAGDTPSISYSGRCGGSATVTLSGYFVDADATVLQ